MKNFFIFIFFILLNVFFLKGVNAVDDNEYYNFTGRYQLHNRVYKVEMYYNGALIDGTFYPKRMVKFNKQEYLIKLLYNEKKYYSGSIYKFSPMFKNIYYELDLNLDQIPLKGIITKETQGKFKVHLINLKFGDVNIEGNIKHPLNRKEITVSLKYGDRSFSGVYNKRTSKDEYINLSVGDAKFLGKVERTEYYDAFSIKTERLNDINDVFLYLLFDIYLKIDDYPKPD